MDTPGPFQAKDKVGDVVSMDNIDFQVSALGRLVGVRWKMVTVIEHAAAICRSVIELASPANAYQVSGAFYADHRNFVVRFLSISSKGL